MRAEDVASQTVTYSIPDDQAASHIDPTGPELCNSPTTSSRSIVYTYALQEALWHQLWLVNAPTQSPGASTDPRSFNVGERLESAKRDGVEVPPLFLTSGTADNKVDPAGAERLASRLKSLGCDYEWDERRGCDHLFDQDENERMERMHEFLHRHLLKLRVHQSRFHRHGRAIGRPCTSQMLPSCSLHG